MQACGSALAASRLLNTPLELDTVSDRTDDIAADTHTLCQALRPRARPAQGVWSSWRRLAGSFASTGREADAPLPSAEREAVRGRRVRLVRPIAIAAKS